MKKLLFVTCISVILLSSCDWLFEEETGSGKRFWAVDTTKPSSDRNYYYQLTAELLAQNDYCKVYVEKGKGVTKTDAQNMATEYIKIYNIMIDTFGLEFDVTYTNGTKGKLNTLKYADALTDGDGKLTILLLDIKDGYRKGVNDAYVAGYFTPYNFFQAANSNQCDMIYIDTNPGFKEDPEESYSTLAHELQHLMNFTTTLEKRLVYDERGELTDINLMDTWIDEGLASAAEYVYTGKHLVNRWGWYYLNGNGEGLIDKGNNFFVWDNREENQYAILDDYATVYLFFQWLRIQSSKGKDIYKEIIGSNNYNHLAVTNAAAASISQSDYGNGNWEKLLGDWLAANYIYASTGRYGYKDDFDFKIDGTPVTIKGRNLLSINAQTVSLYPGEGVFSKISSSYSKPTDTSSIKYLLLTDAGINSSGPITSGALLTYNRNTDSYVYTYNASGEPNGRKHPDQATGTVTGVVANVNVAAPVNGRSVAAPFRITGPYRIGIGDVRRGAFRDIPPIDILQLNSLMLRE